MTEVETGDNGAISTEGMSRREFVQLLAGLGAATGAAFGGWGALEALVPPGTADTWHKSVCRFCGTGCGIQVGMRGGRVTDVRPDPLATNRGVMCIKGTMLRALPQVKGRLLRPQVRRDGVLREASWEEAMTAAADGFRRAIDEAGPDAVAFYGSGQLYTEESYTANKLFKAGIGTNNVDGNPRLCMASAAVGYVQVFGKDEPPGCYDDLDHADCFFIIGANPAECHPPLFDRVRRRRAASGAKVIVVDPRRTPSADEADIHLPVVPGTDQLLLNAMLHVIFADGLADREFIQRNVAFDDGRGGGDVASFERFLGEYTPEAVAPTVGVSAEDIRRVAHLFARSTATVSLWTMGINQRVQGVFLNNTLNALHLVTGHICRPGATPLSLTGQCNACGGVRDTGSLAHLLPAGRLVAKAEHRAAVEDAWGVPRGTISPQPGHHAVGLFRAMEAGDVRSALVMCTNPAQSMPALDRYRPAMERCFLVVSEAFGDSETAQYADVLLPAALWIEKEGVYGQTERRYQLIEKLLDPPGEARSDLDILTDLAERLGHGDLVSARTPTEVWDEWRTMSAGTGYDFQGMTRERLRAERGLQWPCPTEDHPGTARRYVEGEDPLVAEGRGVHFYGRPDGRARVLFRPYVPSPEEPDDEHPYILTTGRVLEHWHTATMTGRIPELDGSAGPARFQVNPRDALDLDIADGDDIIVRSRYGSVTGRAHISDRPRGGVVFCTFHDARLLVNRAVADNFDPVSKEPEFKITAVAIRKAGA